MLSNADSVELAHAVRLAVGRLARRLRQGTLGELTPLQLSVLASLDRLGALTLGALAEVEAVAAPSISGIVARLEEKGFVFKRPNPEDRRSLLVEATARGRDVLERGRGERTAILAEQLEHLGETERRTLADAVEILTRLGGEQ